MCQHLHLQWPVSTSWGCLPDLHKGRVLTVDCLPGTIDHYCGHGWYRPCPYLKVPWEHLQVLEDLPAVASSCAYNS